MSSSSGWVRSGGGEDWGEEPAPLRPPHLRREELRAAVEFGFSPKYLPQGQGGQGQGHGGQGGFPEISHFSLDDIPPSQRGQGQEERDREKEQEKEEEGLLPPLRRPNVGEIPPDVMSTLLKSGRPQAILNVNQNQQQNAGANVQGQGGGQSSYPSRDYGEPQQPYQHQQQQQVQNHHQHQQQHNPHQHQQQQMQSHPQQQQQQQQNSNGLKFNPNVKDFVPRFQSQEERPQQRQQGQGQHIYTQEQTELAEALAQFQMINTQQPPPPQQQQQAFSPRPYQQEERRRHSQPSRSASAQEYQQEQQEQDENESSVEEFILTTVTDAFADLALNPGSLGRCSKVLLDLFRSGGDEETLGVVCALLLAQSVSNMNFAYSGARLVQLLNKNGVGVPGEKGELVPFKKIFLTKLQEEFVSWKGHLENAPGDPEALARGRSLLYFLGELYMNLLLATGARMNILGYCVLETMQLLVREKEKEQAPNHDNVKAVFQVLKLAGLELESCGDGKMKTEFEKLMKDLSYMAIATSNIKPQTKLLLDTLFELKGKRWGRTEDDDKEVPPSPAPSHKSTSSSSSQNKNNYYEMPDSEDDDEDCILLDDEPEEVQQAYEEFLRTVK